MSLEDNQVENTTTNNPLVLPEKKEQSKFEKYIWDGDNSITAGINSIFGNQEEKKKAGEYFDNMFGGVSEYKKVFKDDKTTVIPDDINEGVNTVKKFQETKGVNVLETLGLKDSYGVNYFNGDKEELTKELGTLDYNLLQEEFKGLNEEEFKELEKRQTKDINSKINEIIKQEISEYKIPNSLDAKANRRKELFDSVAKEVAAEYSLEQGGINQRLDDFIKGKQEEIALKYIQPSEGKTAMESFMNKDSENASVATDNFVRAKIEPELEEFKKELLTLGDHKNEKFIHNMVNEYKEKMVRDQKYLYEQLSITKNQEEREKMYGIIHKQIEAREKLFKNVIRKTKTAIKGKGGAWYESGDFDDDVKAAYKDTIENLLTEEERQALLKRDGSDIASAMYHDNLEMRKRITEMNKGIRDGDISDTLTGFALAVGNGIQQVGHGIAGLVSPVTSAVAQVSSFKSDDFEKIYYDEYELNTANDSTGIKIAQHLLYNIDDVADAVVPMLFGNAATGINKVAKPFNWAVNKIKGIKPGMVQPVFKRNTAKGLNVGAIRTIQYGAQGLSESVIGSAIVDRQLKQADTDTNAFVNATLDPLLEPLMRGVGKGWVAGLHTAPGQVVTSGIKANWYSSGAYKFMTKDSSIDEILTGIIAKDKAEGVETSRQEAFKSLDTAWKLINTISQESGTQLFKEGKVNTDTMIDTIRTHRDELAENYKYDANYLLTNNGLIMKMFGVQDDIKLKLNNIEKSYDLLNSGNKLAKEVAANEINKTLNKVIPSLQGEAQIGGILHFKLDVNEKEKLIEEYTTLVNQIKGEKDVLKKKKLSTDMFERLKILHASDRNMVPMNEKVGQDIVLFDPKTMQEVKIPRNLIDKLETDELQGLLDTGKIQITDKNKVDLGIDRMGGKELSMVGGESIARNLGNIDHKVKDAIIRTFLSKDELGKNARGEGYSSGTQDGVTNADILAGLKDLFGDENVGELKLDEIDKLGGRKGVAEHMQKQDANIVFAHGTYPDATDPTKLNDIFYIGVGGKMIEAGFDITSSLGSKHKKPYLTYHEKSSAVIGNIMTQSNFTSGMQHALPLNRISNFSKFNLKDFVIQQFDNFGSEDLPLVKTSLSGEKTLTKEGNERLTFITEQLKHIDIEDTKLNQLISEIFTMKILNHYDIMKTLLTKGNIKSVEDFNKVMDGLVGIRTKEKIAEEFKPYYNVDNFKKQANDIYDTYIREQEIALSNDKVLLKKEQDKYITRDEDLEIRNKNIETLEKRILEREDKIKGASRGDMIENYIFDQFSKSFNGYFDNYLFDKIGLEGKVKLKTNLTSKTKKVLEDIEKIDMQIDDFPYGVSDPSKGLEKAKERVSKITDKEKEQLNELRTKKEQLQKELDKLETEAELEINKIKGSYNTMKKRGRSSLGKLYYKYIPDERGKKTVRLYDLLKDIDKEAEYFGKNPEHLEYFIDDIVKADKSISGIPGVKFSKDTIRTILYKSTDVRMKEVLGGIRDHSESLIENPVEKIFARSLTGAKNNESEIGDKLFNYLKKEFGGEDEDNLMELYHKGGKFKEEIDYFFTKQEGQQHNQVRLKAISQSKDKLVQFKSFIRKHLKDSGIKFELKKGDKIYDGTDELINNTVQTLFKRFKALRESGKRNYLFNELSTDKPYYYIDDKKVDDKKIDDKKVDDKKIDDKKVDDKKVGKKVANNELSINKEHIGEKPLLIKELEEKILGYRSIAINKLGFLKNLRIKKGGKTFKLNLVTDKEVNRKQADYFVYDSYKDIFDIINTKDFKDLPEDTQRFLSKHNKIKKSLITYDDLRGQLRDGLGMDDNEFLMGTFGDKGSYIQSYKGDKAIGLKDVTEEYTNKYIEELKIHPNDLVNKDGVRDLNNLVKRESALLSTHKVFEDVDYDLDLYVIKEDNLKIPALQKLYDDKLLPSYIDTNWDDIVQILKDYDKDFEPRDIENWSTEEKFGYINKVYKNDNQDGTSFWSNELAELQDTLAGHTDKKDKAIKNHMTGIGADGYRYLCKTLFNRSRIQDGDNIKTNAVVIGISSLKLGKGSLVKSKPGHKITINGVEHEVEGIIKGAKTSHFLNAKSESYKVKGKYTLNKQVINTFPLDLVQEYIGVVEEDIVNYVETELQTLGIFDKNLDLYGDASEWIIHIQKTLGVGGATDEVINSKIGGILDHIKTMIDKNPISATNPTILQSKIDLPRGEQLKRNEVIVAKNGKIHKNILKTLDEEIEKLEKGGKKLKKKELERLKFLYQQKHGEVPLHITTFRSPVPTKENTGTYRIRFAEDVGLNRKVKATGKIVPGKTFVQSNDIIGHPESVFVKEEGDFDGDTVIVIPLASKISEIVSKSSLGYKVEEDLYSKIIDGSFRNKIISVKQIEDSGIKDEGVKDIIQIRHKNMEAKETVDIVASGSKVENILRQYIEGDGEEYLKLTVDTTDGVRTLEQVLDQTKKLNGDKGLEVQGDFSSALGGAQQIVLDFAKSDATHFPKQEWLDAITNALGIETKEAKAYFYNNFISNISTGFNETLKVLDPYKIGGVMSRKEGNNYPDLNSSLGYQRELLEFTLNKYGDTFNKLKQFSEQDFILNKIITEEVTIFKGENNQKELQRIVNGIKQQGFVSSEYNEKFPDSITRQDIIQLFEGTGLIKEKIINIFSDNIDIDTGVIIDYNVVLKDLEDAGINIEKNKYPLAIYSLAFGNRKLFNILDETEKVKYLNYATRTKIDKGKSGIDKFNTDYRPEVLIKDLTDSNVTEKEIKEKLDLSKEEIEKYLIDVEKQIINKEKEIAYYKGDKKLEDIKEKIEEIEDINKVTTPEIKEINGIKVVEKKNIKSSSSKEETLIGAQKITKNGEHAIYVSNKGVEKTFKDKSWTNPGELTDGSKSTPLPKDQFKTADELKEFMIAHEYAHTTQPKYDKTKQTLGQREDEANQIAFNLIEEKQPKIKYKDLPKIEQPKIDIKDTITAEEKSLYESIDYNSVSNVGKEVNKITEELEELGSTKEEFEKMSEQIDNIKKGFKESKPIKVVENPMIKYSDDYIKSLDLITSYKGYEIKEFNNAITEVRRMEGFLKQGTRTVVADYLYSRDEDAVDELNLIRQVMLDKDMHSKAPVMRKMHVDLIKDTVNALKKEGVDKADMDNIVRLLNNNAFNSTQLVKGKYIFVHDKYMKDLNKSIDDFNAKKKGYEITNAQRDILLNAGKKYNADEPDSFMSIILDGLNKMNDQYKDRGGYRLDQYKAKEQFIDDILGFYNGDIEFYFRRKGIIKPTNSARANEVAFTEYLLENAKKQGMDLSSKSKINAEKKRMKKIYKFLYNRKDGWITRLIKEGQAGYYGLSYQTGSLLLGGMGHVAAATQIISNYLELIAMKRLLGNRETQAMEVLQKMKLYGENTASQGQGVDNVTVETTIGRLQKTSSIVTKGMANKAMEGAAWLGDKAPGNKLMNMLGTKNPYKKNAIANIFDTMTTEPLLAVDMLNDAMRREMTILHIMDARGLNHKQLIEWAGESATNAAELRRHFYKKYNELGGAVISTSGIYRETMFTLSGPAVLRPFMQMFRFLNGWSIAKVATLGEKAMLLYKAQDSYRSGDIATAKAQLNEFTQFSAALMLNIGMAAGIGLKLEKYDHSDEDERTSVTQLVSNMTNSLTAIEILISRELENATASSNYGIDVQAGSVMLGMMKHMTRFLKTNPVKVITTMNERQEQFPDEDIFTSFRTSLQSLTSSYLRYGFGSQLDNFYSDIDGTDNKALMAYNPPNIRQQLALQEYKQKTFAKLDTAFFGAFGDLAMSYINPKYFTNDVIKESHKQFSKDTEMMKIKDLGLGIGGYDLNTLMVTDGELDQDMIKKLYKDIITFQSVGDRFDQPGRKIVESYSYNPKMDDFITNSLNELGIDRDDFITNGKVRTPGIAKLLLLADKKPEFGVKHITSYVAEQKYYELMKEEQDKIKEETGAFHRTGQMPNETKALVQAQTLKRLQNEGLLDLNKENHTIIQGHHMNKFHPDLIERLKDGKMLGSVKDAMNGLVISTRNMEDGDTSAIYLQSSYTRMLKGLATIYSGGELVKLTPEATENLAEFANHILYQIDDSTQPQKEKIAKQAAMLSALDKTTNGILRDNKVFNYLSRPGQKKLMSWLYKTSDKLLEYDSEAIINAENKNTFKKKGSYTNYARKGMSSPFMSGARPGFSKQFPQIPKFIQGKSVPKGYQEIIDYARPTDKGFDYMNFPAVQALNIALTREMFKDILTQAQPKIKVTTKKAKPQVGRVKIKKKKARLPKGRIRTEKQPTYKRSTTITGLPGDLITKAF